MKQFRIFHFRFSIETFDHKRIVRVLISTTLLALCTLAEAQQPKKVHRIGWLRSTAGSTATIPARYEAFRQGLHDLGYIEGRNIVIEQRVDAAELVRLNVEVIVTTGTTGALAAKEATRTIPIIITTGTDPVARGVVSSLARPGGNITGVTNGSTELGGKRLELLKETIPYLTRVAVLWNPEDPSSLAVFNQMGVASKALGLQIQSLQARSAIDIENGFKAAASARAQALSVLQTVLINAERKRIIELTSENHLPTMFGEVAQVESGGLMSYAPNTLELFRRAATYVDKILKGAKPADLPVEQPTKFELVINLKTAKQLGLTIPPNALARADKVIR